MDTLSSPDSCLSGCNRGNNCTMIKWISQFLDLTPKVQNETRRMPVLPQSTNIVTKNQSCATTLHVIASARQQNEHVSF